MGDVAFRRPECGGQLADRRGLLAQREQQFMADARVYKDSVSGLNMVTPEAVSKWYTITIQTDDGPPPGFTITATPVAGTGQVEDGALTIDQAGTKLPASKW